MAAGFHEKLQKEEEDGESEDEAPRVTKTPSVGTQRDCNLLLDFISAVNTQVTEGGGHEQKNEQHQQKGRSSNDGASSPASALMAPDMCVCVM